MSQISKYMSVRPITIKPRQSVAAAYELMSKHKIRHLPVMDDGELVGIVSQRDLFFLESLEALDPEKVMVREAMTLKPYAVEPDAPVRDVAREMADHKYGAAVVCRDGKVVGVFTTNDALRALIALDASKPERTPPRRRALGKADGAQER
jgi:acetoin utilization protein AcuB